MKRLNALLIVVLVALPLSASAATTSKPNLVFILCDDLGYGDVRCFNPSGKIPTPNMDRLAAQGMRFTDAHSSSAVCSPTRYSLLTGRYNWRSRLQSGVLGGLSPRLIEEGRLTVAQMLREQGYHTAAIGKWHVGMDWARVAGGRVTELNIETSNQVRNVDYSQPIRNGPNAVGFDYYFGISASLDMVPYTFIENDRVTRLPTTDKRFPMTLGVDGKHTRFGPGAPEFEAENVLPTLTRRATEHITARAADARNGRPFFLYVPFNAPHTPILPTKEWQGKSGISPYADFVMQTDASIGAILTALETHRLASNTLVIVTSDNGCSPEANFPQLAEAGHNPSHIFRGTKADIFDGGHRVPFIARWPGYVKAGSTNDALICLMDYMATCAELLGVKLPPNAAEDSVSFLPALLGQRGQSLRDTLVHHSINGSFAIRQGDWKLEICSDSGGWSAPKPGSAEAKSLPTIQLYDLAADVGETNNLHAAHPEIVARLTAQLEEQIATGRSTPGPPQTNTVNVRLRKNAAAAVASNGAPRPNIVYLLIDDLGRADMGFMGSKDVRTPNIDRLARAGAILDSYYVQPVCSPTRAALMTGRYATRTGVYGVVRPGAPWGLPLEERTLADALREVGYTTAICGKWHLGEFQTAYTPTRRGFDHQYGHMFGALDYFTHIRDGKPDWYRDDQPLKEEGYSTHLIAREACRLIRTQPADKPLFLYVPFNGVHGPHQVPEEYKKAYPNLTGVRQTMAGMISAVDEAIGQITAALDERGLRTNTLIIFSSDNGGPGPNRVTMNTPLRAGKGTIYEGGLRVCAFATWPGVIPAGTTNREPMHAVDWYPTLLKLVGAPLKQKLPLDGLDYWPVLTQGAKSPHDALLLVGNQPSRAAVRMGDWKLLLNASERLADEATNETSNVAGTVELYNLAEDVSESSNLASAEPGRVKAMRARLDQFLKDAVTPGNLATAKPAAKPRRAAQRR